MGYDFETDQQYNFETTISMTVDIGKTCFAPGETVNGTIILKPKEGNPQPFLQNPQATLYIHEFSYYQYMVNEVDPRTNMPHFETKEAQENYTLLNIPLDFSNFNNANVSEVLKLPFTFQIPLRIYPSCYFDTKTFVRHYLCIEFPSIGAKKTTIIVIKNLPYFSSYNQLYQSPAMCFREMKKHKLFFSQGSFTASIKLDKNAFAYDEFVPFQVDIDLSKMSLNIKKIKVSLRRGINKNYQYNHAQNYQREIEGVGKKYLEFNSNQKKIHIEDVLAIDADKNPKNIYKTLDKDNRKTSEKYNGIKLYPTCYGGLLSVEYFIKMEIEMDTVWSTNEEFVIPIDFYEPFSTGQNTNPQPNMPNSQNNQENLPSMDEVMQKQPESGNENPIPPSEGNNTNSNNNNNFISYPSF